MGKIQGPTDPTKAQARLELLLSVLGGKGPASQIIYGYHQKTGEPHYGGGLSSFGYPSEMLRKAYPELDRLDFDELSLDLQQVRLDDSAAHNMMKRIGELKREWSDEDAASAESNERLIADAERVLYSMDFEAGVSHLASMRLGDSSARTCLGGDCCISVESRHSFAPKVCHNGSNEELTVRGVEPWTPMNVTRRCR